VCQSACQFLAVPVSPWTLPAAVQLLASLLLWPSRLLQLLPDAESEKIRVPCLVWVPAQVAPTAVLVPVPVSVPVLVSVLVPVSLPLPVPPVACLPSPTCPTQRADWAVAPKQVAPQREWRTPPVAAPS
jgi:hypothetical protein